MGTVLEARGLRVGSLASPLVGPLDLTVGAGERVALVGASGAGKSLTVNALLDAAAVPVGAVFQESALALEPLVRVGRQLGLPLTGVGRAERRARVTEMLARLGLPDVARAYPMELSGGQRQRIALGLAMIRSPALLIADEPTSALDVLTQALILEALDAELTRAGAALLLVSHDLALVSRICTRVLVMDAGLIVESGSPAGLFAEPAHPATRRLVTAARELGVTA